MTSAGPSVPDRRDGRTYRIDIPESEKIAAQWEARHDLAARRDRGDALAVQHYLTHARSEEVRRSQEHHPREHASEGSARAVSAPPAPPAPPAPERPRSLVSRLFRPRKR